MSALHRRAPSLAGRLAAFWLAVLAGGPCTAQDADAATGDGPAAGTVRLTADGGFVVEGALLSFDGAFYRVETATGPVTVDAARATCTGACPDPGLSRIAISGDADAARVLMPALVRAYAAARGMTVEDRQGTLVLRADEAAVLEIALRPNGTEEGFADLLAGEADMVLARRPVRPLEAALARDAGLGDLTDPLRARTLADGALAVVVSEGSPLRSLTLPQLAAVFAGALADWSGLGLGADGPVRLHLPEGGSGPAQAFEDTVMAPSGLSLAESAITRHADDGALRSAVGADPGAIGVLRVEAAGDGVRALALGGGCAPPAAPDPFAVASGDYPLHLPVLLYIPAQPLPGPARDLAAWIVTPDAAAAARRAGFGVEASPIAFEAQGARLAAGIAAVDVAGLPDLKDAAAILSGYRRRAVTFRFEDGSARLDADGETAARRLAAEVGAGTEGGTRLLFVGFSDGPDAADARLSRLRAGLVRDHVADLAGDSGAVEMRSAGFGAALPVACGDTVWGRQANRRVELWEPVN